MSMAVGSKLQLEPGSWTEATYDVVIGIAVGAAHSFYIVTRWWMAHVVRPMLNAMGVQSPITGGPSATASNREKTLKVVAVGYGRTGTVSCWIVGKISVQNQNTNESLRCLDFLETAGALCTIILIAGCYFRGYSFLLLLMLTN